MVEMEKAIGSSEEEEMKSREEKKK